MTKPRSKKPTKTKKAAAPLEDFDIVEDLGHDDPDPDHVCDTALDPYSIGFGAAMAVRAIDESPMLRIAVLTRLQTFFSEADGGLSANVVAMTLGFEAAFSGEERNHE